MKAIVNPRVLESPDCAGAVISFHRSQWRSLLLRCNPTEPGAPDRGASGTVYRAISGQSGLYFGKLSGTVVAEASPGPRFRRNLPISPVQSRKLFSVLRSIIDDESGQGLVEYALIIALVSLAAIAVLSTLGRKVKNSLNSAAASLS
jgi:pilus assembly protein Flp/PilA